MKVRHYGLYYAGTPYYSCDQFIVDNWERAAAPDGTIMDRLKVLKPTFPCDNYKSVTDNYTLQTETGPLHAHEVILQNICTGLGLNIEDCYMHWQEETTIDWDYTGTNPDIVVYPAGSRIEKYRKAHQSGAMQRRATRFGGPAETALIQNIVYWATLQSPAGRNWDGIFLDNCGNSFYNYGTTILSGGTVTEFGAKIYQLNQWTGRQEQSPAFLAWYWAGQRAYLASVRTALHALSPSRAMTINVANAWSNDYVTYGCCDRIYMEFVGHFTRDWSLFTIASHNANHALCEANGVYLSMAPPIGYGATPALSDDEIMQNALCQHLLVATNFSTTHNQDLTWPNSAGWPQRVIGPCEAVVAATSGSRLGDVAGPLEIFWEGDINGHHRIIYSKAFTRGMVFGCMYNHGSPDNPGLTSELYSFPRPSQMRILYPDGALSQTPHPANVDIKNGGGAILVL